MGQSLHPMKPHEAHTARGAKRLQTHPNPQGASPMPLPLCPCPCSTACLPCHAAPAGALLPLPCSLCPTACPYQAAGRQRRHSLTELTGPRSILEADLPAPDHSRPKDQQSALLVAALLSRWRHHAHNGPAAAE